MSWTKVPPGALVLVAAALTKLLHEDTPARSILSFFCKGMSGQTRKFEGAMIVFQQRAMTWQQLINLQQLASVNGLDHLNLQKTGLRLGNLCLT